MPQDDEVRKGHREMLVDGLMRIFGEFNQDMLERVLPRLDWVELAGGDVLFQQGEADDSLYFVISGRLRACRVDDAGREAVLGEVARGETVGEMAFFTGEPRAATIVALRDCVLAKFSGRVFRELLMAYPLISLNITRLVIERLQRASMLRKPGAKPVTLAMAAITQGLDLRALSERLAHALRPFGSTLVVTADLMGEWLGDATAAQALRSDADWSHRIARKLEQVETENHFVLFVADALPTQWTRRCLRHCDEVLLFATAGTAAAPSPLEIECLRPAAERNRLRQTLVLLHPLGTRTPLGTAAWHGSRALARHIHIRGELQRDWERLGRLVSGNSTGLVLSGGGARGFAHLGVMKALEEAGIGYDLAGGTSIGAVMAAYAGMDLPADDIIASAREAFKMNPTGDYNLVPLISLVGGKRLRKIIDSAVMAAMGEDILIEDLWKGFFCVTSNYSMSSECVLTRGPLAKSIRASVSIPGALPPVMLDGDLHIDGGTFNNFPADVMNRMGALRIVGVDLLRDRSFKYQMDEVPSAGRLLADKLRGRRNRLPGLTSLLLNTSTMYSYARQRETHRLVDMYFSPGVHRFGMLDWAQFDRIVQAGYDYARAELDRDGFAKALTAHPAREREAEEVQLPDIAAGGAQLPA
jgi:NTE family protein